MKSSPGDDSALRDSAGSSSDGFQNQQVEDGRKSLDSRSHNLVGRVVNFLRSHPKLCLFLLTPGIVEYLLGSSPLYLLVVSPYAFVIQLALNAGLYLPGALLIREAMIRWKKGWGSVLLLGAAYGILEEGLAFNTLFNPKSAVVGAFGSYGHWLGVNWVWTAEVIPIHMVFSIALPILLLGLALPETQGRSLLTSRRSLAFAFSILTLEVCLIPLIEFRKYHVWMGLPLLVSSLVAIGLLVIAARMAPSGIVHAMTENPRIRPILAGLVGAMFYPSAILLDQYGMYIHLPAAWTTALMLGTLVLYLVIVLRTLGRTENYRQLIAFGFGLILPLMVGGAAEEIFLPLILVADAIAIWFFWKLWRKYAPEPQVGQRDSRT